MSYKEKKEENRREIDFLLGQLDMKRKYRGIKKELMTFTMACIITIVLVLSAGSIYLTYDTTRRVTGKKLKGNFKTSQSILFLSSELRIKPYSVFIGGNAVKHFMPFAAME